MALAYVVVTLVLGTGDMLAHGTPFTAEFSGQLIGPLQFFLLYRCVVSLSTRRSCGDGHCAFTFG